MMSRIGRSLQVAAAAFFVACAAPALAQMGVQNHAVPVGHGAGSGSFNSVGPCLAGIPIVGAGVSADPVCGRVANTGLAQANAATFKCNPTAGTADLQDCTIGGLTHKGSPTPGADKHFYLDASTNTLVWCTIAECGTSSGVSDFNGLTGSVKFPTIPGGRLTLTSGTAITTSDVTGATTIYYTPYIHDWIDIYDGSNWVPKQFSELSLPLDNNSGDTGYQQAGKNFHLCVFINSSVVTLGTGVAWTGDTNPGSGAGTAETELFNGRLVNKNAMNVRFGASTGQIVSVPARQCRIVGGARMTANGQTEDSLVNRYVSNLHNAVDRAMVAPAADPSWTINVTGGYAQANSNAANQFNYFHVVGGRELSAKVAHASQGTSGTFGFHIAGIGIDSTTVNSANAGYIPANSNNTFFAAAIGQYEGFPGIGKHSIIWVEQAITASRSAGGSSQYAISGRTVN